VAPVLVGAASCLSCSPWLSGLVSSFFS
jgi:hypothetical protein